MIIRRTVASNLKELARPILMPKDYEIKMLRQKLRKTEKVLVRTALKLAKAQGRYSRALTKIKNLVDELLEIK
jgi:hypothetical protein